MASIADSIIKEAQQMVRRELENEADRAKRALVRATEDAMDNFYSVPEGMYYDRTGAFKEAYEEYEKKNTRDPEHMVITVGVTFENTPNYAKHGIPLEDIYSLNLSGDHGGNGNHSDDIIERVSAAADALVQG